MSTSSSQSLADAYISVSSAYFEPTRVTENLATLIDLILTNRLENIVSSGVIHVRISDHGLILNVVRNFKRFSINNFRSDLLQVPWDLIFAFRDPNASWILWKSFFDEILNKHAPLFNKRIRSRQSRWITLAIKQYNTKTAAYENVS